MAKLGDIVDEMEEWSEMFQDATTPEEEFAIGQKLNEIEIEFSEKIKSYLNLLKSLDANLMEFDKELERLQNLKKRNLKTQEFLKNNLIGLMKAKNLRTLKSGTNKITLCKNGGKQPIWNCDPKDLPARFQKEKVEYKADKEKIREYLDEIIEAGDKQEQERTQHLFHYEPRGEHLSIR